MQLREQLPRQKDPIVLGQRRAEMEEQAHYLESLDPAVWPYLFVLGAAREGLGFSFLGGVGGVDLPVWEGLRLTPEYGGPLEVGQASLTGRLTVRRAGDFRFEAASTTQRQNIIDGYAAERLAWPEGQEDNWLESLQRFLDNYINGYYNYNWERLSLDDASWSWRDRLWTGAGDRLLLALSQRRREDESLVVPVRGPDGTLDLKQNLDLVGREPAELAAWVIPGTKASWDELRARAQQSPLLRYGAFDKATTVWFGIRGPKGLLPKGDTKAAAAPEAEAPQETEAQDEAIGGSIPDAVARVQTAMAALPGGMKVRVA